MDIRTIKVVPRLMLGRGFMMSVILAKTIVKQRAVTGLLKYMRSSSKPTDLSLRKKMSCFIPQDYSSS